MINTSHGGGDDRFILPRRDVNFDGYFMDEKISPYMPIVTKKRVQEAYRRRRIKKAMEDALKCSSNFTIHRSSWEIKRKPFWSSKKRAKPSMVVSQLLGTPVFGSNDPWSNVADITANGKLLSKFEKELAESNDFFENPGELEPIKNVEASLLSALWVNSNGSEIILGFIGGTLWVMSGTGKIDRNFQMIHCQHYESPCTIRCVSKHPVRENIIYWCCRHGLYAWKNKLNYKFIPKIHMKRITCMKLSPSGAYLATAALEEGVKIWDALNLSLKHHLIPGTTVAKAMDWHPWDFNLLATGEWGGDGKIKIWRCSLQQPLVAEILHQPCFIFSLRFHPFTGELVYAQWIEDDDEDMRKGETTIVVLNGFGEVSDCSSPSITGVITHFFWGPGGYELMVGGTTDILVKFEFLKKPTKQQIKGKINDNSCNFNMRQLLHIR